MGRNTGSEKDRFLTQCESTWEEMRYWDWKWGKRDGNAKLHIRPWTTIPPPLSFLPFHFTHVMIQSQNMSKICSLRQSLFRSSGSHCLAEKQAFTLWIYMMCSQLGSWLVSFCCHARHHHSLLTVLYSASLCKCNNVSISDSVCVGGGMKIKWNKRRKKTCCKQETETELAHASVKHLQQQICCF